MFVNVHHNLLVHPVNLVRNSRELQQNKNEGLVFLVNPCVNGNPCLNSGTCFGRVLANGTLSTQCFCLQGYTGVLCESNRH